MTTTLPAPELAEGRPGRRSWPVPVVLLVLSIIPVVAGTLRLVHVAGGPAVLPADARFAGFPGALVVHIVGAAVYAVVGVLQFVPRWRRRHRAWHRRAGRVLVVAGLAVAGSALWLTLFYEAQPGTGGLLLVLRLVFGPALVTCLALGFLAIRRRDVRTHRAWMIRGYAIALGAGTQVFTEGFGEALLGQGDVRGDLFKASAWTINLLVAEWAIRRRPRPRRRAPT